MLMKNVKKLVLKIAAGITAAVLIGGILFITNAFVGNPVSAKIAHNAIKQYVNKNYSFLDLEVGKASYNFKDSSYMAKAKSKSNIDIHFSVYSKGGKVLRDDYSYSVTGKMNVLQRLEEEYSLEVKSLIAREPGLENCNVRVLYSKDEYEFPNSILEPGMKFDKNLPLDAEISINVRLEDISMSNISRLFTDAHNFFVKNGYVFRQYDMMSERDGTVVMINRVRPQEIEGGQLEKLLEEAKEKESDNGIMVFIKTDKK